MDRYRYQNLVIWHDCFPNGCQIRTRSWQTQYLHSEVLNWYRCTFLLDASKFLPIQEKLEAEEVCKKINGIINFVEEQEPEPIVEEKPVLEEKPAKVEKM